MRKLHTHIKRVRTYTLPEPQQNQGKLRDRYDCYVEACKQSGEPCKSFDEWLNS